MKPTKETLETLNKIFYSIFNYCEWFRSQEDSLVYSKDRIIEIVNNEEDISKIEIEFPGLEEVLEITIEDLLTLGKEIDSLEIDTDKIIRTDIRSIYTVTSDNGPFVGEMNFEPLKLSNDITIDLISDSFFVGLAATKLNEYERWWGTFSQYLAIEICYSSKEKRLDNKKEHELVDAYLFEIADTANLFLMQVAISVPKDAIDDFSNYIEDDRMIKLRPLLPFSEQMLLFASAIQINDQTSKFLNFYKILESYSTIAMNIEAYELMRIKLDTSLSEIDKGVFIKSIFDLANSVQERRNDEALFIQSLNTCIDFIGLFPLLPSDLKQKTRKVVQIKEEFNYGIEKQKLTTIINVVGRIIYKTRNKLVHGKMNFIVSGDEIPEKDFIQLNIFMKAASSQAIRWYSRLPKHLKLEVL